MPFSGDTAIKGILSPAQKNELLRRMTDLIVEIEVGDVPRKKARRGRGPQRVSFEKREASSRSVKVRYFEAIE